MPASRTRSSPCRAGPKGGGSPVSNWSGTRTRPWRQLPRTAARRTTYLLDVRTPEEFATGHLPGSVSAPGGQLVQAIDRWVGTRGARVVLIDDAEVRAVMTAQWLMQMGWDVVV